MTQKDSEDDIGDGPAPPPAEAQPNRLEEPAVLEPVAPTPSGAQRGDDTPPGPAVDATDDDAEHVVDRQDGPSAIDDASIPAGPGDDSTPAGPYLARIAAFVTLPGDGPPPTSVAEVAAPAELPTPPEEAADPAPAEIPADLQPSPVLDETPPPIADFAEATALPPAEASPQPAEPPAPTPAPEPAADAEPAPYTADDAPITIIRRAWERPPPLAVTPPWVWRDVAPDIVQRPRDPASDAPVAPSGSTTEPVPATLADAVVPLREDPPVDPSVVAEPVSPAEAIDPAARHESLVPPDTPIEAIVPPSVPAPPIHREPPAPAPRPAPPSPPAAPSAPEPLTAWRPTEPPQEQRIEPQWQRRVEPYAGFRDARPGDISRDGFAAPPASDWDRYKAYARTALRYAGYAIGGYFALVFVLILLYRVVNPPASSLMIAQALTGTDVRQEWVPLDYISPALVRAVIVSEDWSFCEHYGIDIKAIEQAIEKSGNGIPRGASTISMQTTKNLFLWNAKSYIRKAVELPLTLMIELIWPKSRILEIYLNVAEWGPGIFGAEAAAQYHFNKPASRLGEREAAQLAASLPNPIIREAGDPGPRTARKASVIQSRMRNAGGAAACVLGDR